MNGDKGCAVGAAPGPGAVPGGVCPKTLRHPAGGLPLGDRRDRPQHRKLCVTRQAVSRWETGETVPSTDTLKEIAKTFQVPVDRLLGYPAGFCQSCGMALTLAGLVLSQGRSLRPRAKAEQS